MRDPIDECLADQTLLELVEGRLDEASRERAAGHASRCAECRQLMMLLARRSASPMATTMHASGSAAAMAEVGAEELRPGDVVGRYVVHSRIGAGGMGVVYAAHDPELGRSVALKVLRTDLDRASVRERMRERLRREAQAMAQLAHPNVVAVHDVGAAGERVFLTMELVEGTTLAEWTTERPRGLAELLAQFLAAGRGLAAAHAAGLVHRDFKPENVLVGVDGRVRVSDFGLARGAADLDSALGVATEEGVTGERGMLTAPGAVVGTPYYMAPEQRRGEEADARSDQFSFCVALYAAIHRKRPEEGVADGVRVPRRIRRALQRGLAAAPADRFASMDALLGALAGTQRRWPWVAAVAVVAGLVGVMVSPPAAPMCRDAERHLIGVWDPERRAAIEAGVVQTGAPYAGASVQAVTAVMDAYAGRWVAMRTDACEATRVHGEQTEAQLELRMACLDGRLRELRALGDRLIAADAAVAERAVRAAYSLSEIEGCADVEALASPLAPPTGAAGRGRLDELRGRLAEVKSLRDAGQYRRGLTAARVLVRDAEALTYRPLVADALHLEGALAAELGEFAAAETSLARAVWAAEASRHDAAVVRALTEMISVVGLRLARPSEAEGLRGRVTAVLERMHRPVEPEAGLLEATAAVAIDSGRFAEAEADLARALGLLEGRHGANDLRLTAPLRTLGHAALQRGDGERAAVSIRRALEIQRRVLGEEHPEVAASLESLAGAEYLMSAYEAAEGHYAQAQAVYERAFGAEHHKVANVLHNRGLVRLWQGEALEAAELHRRATELASRTLGPEHPMVASYLEAHASALETAGRPAEALVLLERALGIQKAKLGANHPRLAATLHSIGRVKLALGDYEAARAATLASREVYASALGEPEDPAVARTLGEVELRLGEADAAVATLEAAVRRHVATDDPGEVAWTEGVLARALYAAGERARGAALARTARERMAADERMGEQKAELERWMAEQKIL